MICWPGVRLLCTSEPIALSLTRARSALATATFTSASSSANRTSRSEVSMSASLRRPLPRKRPNVSPRRAVRESNMNL